MHKLKFVSPTGIIKPREWEASTQGGLVDFLFDGYLKSYAGGKENLNKAIDDVLGKTLESHGTYCGKTIVHGSAGRRGGDSTTVFAYIDNGDYYIIAIGKHLSGSTYKLSYHYQNNSNGMKEGDIYDISKSGQVVKS